MVGHLTGVGTGQEVALVRGVHDEAAALCSTTEGTDVRVGQDVAEGSTDFEQAAVLVLVAGVADPLVKPGLNAVEFQGNHFRTGTEGLSDGRGLHHAHHGVERRLTGRQEDVRNPFLAEGRASVGEVHEEVEGRGRFSVAVDGGPNPRVGPGHQVARGVLSETGWGVASPSQSVVERHVAVHQRRVVNAVEWVGVGNDASVAKTPKDDLPLGEFLPFRPEEQVVVVAGVTLKDGPAHAFFVAG